MSNRVLTIRLENDTNENDEHDDVTIVSEVLRLLRDGFTSGIAPTWCIAQQEQRPYVCDNCGRVATREELPHAKDLLQRLVPGEIYTDRECPECHALCFPKQ